MKYIDCCRQYECVTPLCASSHIEQREMSWSTKCVGFGSDTSLGVPVCKKHQSAERKTATGTDKSTDDRLNQTIRYPRMPVKSNWLKTTALRPASATLAYRGTIRTFIPRQLHVHKASHKKQTTTWPTFLIQ